MAEATREQLNERAHQTDYASKIDMSVGSVVGAPQPTGYFSLGFNSHSTLTITQRPLYLATCR